MTGTQKDLMRRLVDALCAAEGELEQIEEIDIPLPADVRDALYERDALSAVMHRFGEEAGCRERLVELYREERQRVQRSDPLRRYSSPRVAADEDVKRELASVHEDIRRADMIGTIPDGIAVPL